MDPPEQSEDKKLHEVEAEKELEVISWATSVATGWICMSENRNKIACSLSNMWAFTI